MFGYVVIKNFAWDLPTHIEFSLLFRGRLWSRREGPNKTYYLSSFWRWRHPDSRNTRRYTAQFHAKLFWGRNFCSSRSCHLKLNRLLSYTDILVAQVRIIFIRCPWIVVIIPVGWSFLHNIGCEVTACLLSFFKDIRQRSYLVGTNAEIINYCLMLPRHSKGLVWATMLLGSIINLNDCRVVVVVVVVVVVSAHWKIVA